MAEAAKRPESAAEMIRRVQENLSRERLLTSSEQQEKPNYPECQGTGWITVVQESEYRTVRPCRCRQRMIAEARLRDMLEGWPEYRAARFEAMEPRSPAQATALERLKAAPQESYYMHGTYSVGKTHLMIAQYRTVALAGIPYAEGRNVTKGPVRARAVERLPC